jgi:hypothetical protein
MAEQHSHHHQYNSIIFNHKSVTTNALKHTMARSSSRGSLLLLLAIISLGNFLLFIHYSDLIQQFFFPLLVLFRSSILIGSD